MNVLMIMTSHEKLGDTEKKTGFWLEEFAAPYYIFLDAGAKITLASPAGGQPPLDPQSDVPKAQTEATVRFKKDAAAQRVLANTTTLADIKADIFDAIFFPGGHGLLWWTFALLPRTKFPNRRRSSAEYLLLLIRNL